MPFMGKLISPVNFGYFLYFFRAVFKVFFLMFSAFLSQSFSK
jgi:hypothetical protein